MIIFVIIVLVNTIPILAQPNWYEPSDWNEGLPESVHVYHSSGTWNGMNINSSYIEFDLDEVQLTVEYSEGNAKTPSQWLQEDSSEDDVIMISNGGYFDVDTNVTVSTIVINGVIEGINALTTQYGNFTYYPTRSAFGIHADNTFSPTWIYAINGDDSVQYSYPNPSPNCYYCEPMPFPSANYPDGGQQWTPNYGVGGGPMLLRDGEIHITWQEEVIGPEVTEQVNPRTAICETYNKTIIILVADGRSEYVPGLWLTDLAAIMQSLGCKNAMNLDGGGSTCMLVNGFLVNRPSQPTGERPVPSILKLKRKSGSALEE